MILSKIIGLICFLIVLIIYYKLNYYEMTFVRSTIDNKKYLVRDLPDKQEAANLLSEIRTNILKLTTSLKNSDNKYMPQLISRINNTKFSENGKNNNYTSYSISKGEELVFCLRSKASPNFTQLHDINLIMYVALHELAHIACPIYGHGPPFPEIFSFLATKAVEIGIYNRIDFNNNHTEYCGLTIKESII